MSDTLIEIREAIDTFDAERARELLRDELKGDPTAEAYYLASLVALNDAQRDIFLQKAVALDPFHAEATAGLAKASPNQQPVKKSEPVSKAEPQIEAEPTEEQLKEDEPKFIIGTLKTGITLRKIPDDEGVRVTELPKEAAVIVLTRDEHLEWLNVFYIGSAGHELVGWMKVGSIDTLKMGKTTVRAMDLPITKYEWNTRADIKQLAGIKKSMMDSRNRQGCLFPVLLGGGGYFVFMWGIFGEISVLTWGGAIMLIAGAVWVTVVAVQNGQESKPLLEEWNYLKELAKTDQDRHMDQQIKMAAISTAMQVGGNVITRSTPDRQVITQRNR